MEEGCIRLVDIIMTFRLRRSLGEMNIGHGRLCVCLWVCLYVLVVFPHYFTDPDVIWGNGSGCPLVVHYWEDLQSVHGFFCYDNSVKCEMSASARTRSMPGFLSVTLTHQWHWGHSL